jgi:hypothetical protein
MEISGALETSFAQYIKVGNDGKHDPESWNRAFNMTPRIIEVKRSGGMSETKKRIFYCRGILRNRCNKVNERDAVILLEAAIDSGGDIEDLIRLAKQSNNYRQFERWAWDYIGEIEK